MEARKALFFDKITRFSEKFTPSDRKIADHLIRTYPKCLLKNASQIAQELDVNVSTVTRFFKKIGFKNIRDAHTEFREDVDFIISSPLDRIRKGPRADGEQDDLQSSADLDILNIQNTIGSLNREDLKSLVAILGRKNASFFVMGDRSKPFALAYYFYIQLKSIRSGTRLLGRDKSIIAQSLAEAGEQDVLVLFDFRRYSRLNGEIVDIFRRIGGPIIAFTDSPLAPNARKADLSFLIETKSASMFDSYTAGFTLINLVISHLAISEAEGVGQKHQRLERLYSDLQIFE